ncbi:MAG: phosphoribosylglycinamide formyltransferase [Ruminococcaceae bacterium]|nr:phosphoribosylglycinamide formyltransferase [Oscillospiraceae bacterium]
MLIKDRASVAVLVSGGGTNLGALIKAERQGSMPSVNIVLVVSSNSDAYALRRAESAGIKTAFIAGSGASFENELKKILRENEIDLVVLAGFLKILSRDFVFAYKGRIINIHPSIIPAFCGRGFYGIKVHEAALKQGVKWTGATAHYVNEIPDGGEIILQKPVAVLPNDTAETLQKRVMEEAEHLILPEACEIAAKKIMKEKLK